jgi:hypothetical protein
MNSALAALIAVAVYLALGALASFIVNGFVLWILGGLGLWLTFRLAYAIADGLE